MKLLCDHMLGTLATWLRCFGLDTIYASDEQSDDELMKQAKQNERILLTRDKELIQRAIKQEIPVIPVHSDDLDQQLKIVLSQITFDTSLSFTRCLQCNTLLETRANDQVKHLIPPKVYDQHTHFWFCPHCQQYYWQGTHYHQMQQKIREVLKSLD